MKLHIGPGNSYFPGWINVDVCSTVKADVYSSALAIPYPESSFDLIYASHVLEHLNRHTILAALNHWRSLLKPNGVLRLAVPNFWAICDYYNKTNDLNSLMGLLYGGQDNVFNIHYITFDEKTLTHNLNAVGFSNIKKWEWRDTDHSQFDDFSQAYLPHMDKENGALMSLNLEATK